MKIIGHKKVQDFLAAAKAAGKLSHAYGFVGPQQIGKTTLARVFAADMLGTTVEKLEIHLDFVPVQRGINEKTGKTKKNIDIDQIRELRGRLRRHAAMGGYKIALIEDAHLMNVSASNALLKTLEEPTDKTIIMLVTPYPDALLPTIQSRMQLLHMQRVPDEVMKEGFPNATEDMREKAEGRPGALTRWLSDSEQYEAYVKEWERCEQLFGKPFYEQINLVDDLFGDKTDHIKTRAHMQEALSIWQLVIRKKMLAEKELAGQLTPILDTIQETKRLLGQNVHPRLAVEQILLQMG